MEQQFLGDDIIITVAGLPHPSPESRVAFTSILMANRYNMFSNISANVVTAVRTIIGNPLYYDFLFHGDSKSIIRSICIMVVPSRVEAEKVIAAASAVKAESIQFLATYFYDAPDVEYPDRWEVYSDGIAVLLDSKSVPSYRVTLGKTVEKLMEKASLMRQLADVKVVFQDIKCPWDVPEKTVVKKMSNKTVAFSMPGGLMHETSKTHLMEAIKLLRQVLWNEGYRLIAAAPGETYDFQIELTPSNLDCVFFYDVNPTSTAFANILSEKSYQKIALTAAKRREPAYCCVGFTSDASDITNALAQVRRHALVVGKAIADVLK